MTPDELKELASRPTWSKHVVVWIGSQQDLDELLDGKPQATFDMLDLFDEEESLPADEKQRRAVLKQRLEAKLRELQASVSDRLILRVENAAILARCKASLQGFFDYFGGGRTMVVLSLEGAMPAGRWPTHLEQQVNYDPDGTLKYLRSCLADPVQVYSEQA